MHFSSAHLLRDFYIGAALELNNPEPGQYDLCVPQYNGSAADYQKMTARCAGRVLPGGGRVLPARFLIIQVPHDTAFHLCEVEVYGEGKRFHLGSSNSRMPIY